METTSKTNPVAAVPVDTVGITMRTFPEKVFRLLLCLFYQAVFSELFEFKCALYSKTDLKVSFQGY
jgi:hypothetical protein